MQWARLFYLHGEGQNVNSLLAALDRAIDTGATAFDMSAGEQLRDFQPITEAARQLVGLLHCRAFSGVVNCASGQPVTVRRLVEQRLQERGASLQLNLGIYPYPTHEPMAFWAVTDRLAQLLAAQGAPMAFELHRAAGLPVLQNRTFADAISACASASGDMCLVQDEHTGLVYNQAFDESLLCYDSDYQNEQALSPAFQRHLDQVEGLIARHFAGKRLIEVGCGKGYFLELLRQRGHVVTGIDPAYEGENPDVIKAPFTGIWACRPTPWCCDTYWSTLPTHWPSWMLSPAPTRAG